MIITSPCRKTGFTLIEVLIAVTILSFTMLAILPLIVTTLGVNRSVSLDVRAQTMASQKIEELKVFTPDLIEGCLNGSLDSLEKGKCKSGFTSGGNSCSCDEGVIEKDKDYSFNRRWSINRMPVADGGTNPAPLVFSATIQYVYKGQTKTRLYTSMWGY